MTLPVDPIKDPSSWDSVEFAGIEYPFCEISGFDRESEWDVKKGKGAQGATATFVGISLAKGSVKFVAWESSHFVAFDKIFVMFKYDPAKKKSQAIEIWHPSIVENEINSVVVTKVPPWKHDGNGQYSREVEFLEFRPAPKTSAVGTPANAATSAGGAPGSSTGTPGSQPDPAIKAAQDEFAASLKDAKALGPP